MLEKVYKEAKQENNELREKLSEHIKEYKKLKEVCDEEVSEIFMMKCSVKLRIITIRYLQNIGIGK